MSEIDYIFPNANLSARFISEIYEYAVGFYYYPENNSVRVKTTNKEALESIAESLGGEKA